MPIYRAVSDKLGEANCIKALGELLTNMKEYDVAISYLEDAAQRYHSLGLIANEFGAINSIANLYYKSKEYNKAIDVYSRALDFFPEQAGYILRNRADTYIKLKDADQAARDLVMAARLQSDNAYLYLRRGKLAILRRQYEEALQNFALALERYPRLNYAYFDTGIAYLWMGNSTQAIEAYKKGLALCYSRDDLDDAIYDLEELRRENLSGIEDALKLLNEFSRKK